MSSKRIIFVDGDGKRRHVTTTQAIDLIAQGAIPVGTIDGLECIAAQTNVRVWKRRTQKVMGAAVGFVTRQLVAQ